MIYCPECTVTFNHVEDKEKHVLNKFCRPNINSVEPRKKIKIDAEERKHNSVANSCNPWVKDINLDILHEILKRLNVVDNFRLGFVCKRWHESLHCQSPRPPPSQFPWLITCPPLFKFGATIYQPNYPKILTWRKLIFKHYEPKMLIRRIQRVLNPVDEGVELDQLLDGDERLSESMVGLASHKGWILMASMHIKTSGLRMLLFNPITKAKVNLPEHDNKFVRAAFLVITSSIDDHQLNFLVVFHDSYHINFGRNGDCRWNKMKVNHSDNNINKPLKPNQLNRYRFAFCNGRVYGTETGFETLVTFDPFGDVGTTLDILPMKNAARRKNDPEHHYHYDHFLVESMGELLMVNVVRFQSRFGVEGLPFSELTGAEVFKANFDKMEWTKVTDASISLADRVLFISDNCCFSAKTRDVGVEGGAQLHFVWTEMYSTEWFWVQYDLQHGGLRPKLRMNPTAPDDNQNEYPPLWFQPQYYCSCKIFDK